MKEAGIPEKLFYKIGEVALITGLKPSVLRFWESEFPSLQPQKSGSGQRLYTRREVDLVLDIKRLLYSEKLTIEGAKKRIGRKESKTALMEQDAESSLYDILTDIRTKLQKIRNSL